MSILIDQNTKLLTQGITGKAGLFHSLRCRDYGTQVVGGVTPGKGGQSIEGFPVYNSVRECIDATGANTTMIFVPPPVAGRAIIEAIESGLKLVVAITEGIPVLDMLKVKEVLKAHPGTLLCGPNCPGLVTSGVAKVGIAPGVIHKAGRIGVVSRSGTLTYEAVDQTSRLGLGQTTAVGIGGDAVHGLTHQQVIEMFQNDPATEGIVFIGEIGGTEEEQACEYIKTHVTKPVVGFIAGASAPPGKRMGHAGAIIDGGVGTAQSKTDAMKKAGVLVAPTAAEIGACMVEAINHKSKV